MRPHLLLAPCLLVTGCVQRTITVTSEPPGALVWLNDREIGRTPVTVEFEYYGTYDVRLVGPPDPDGAGYEPLLTSGRAAAPWWELPGLDLIAELLPVALHSRVEWHYVLEPGPDDPQTLVQRARKLRARTEPPDDAD